MARVCGCILAHATIVSSPILRSLPNSLLQALQTKCAPHEDCDVRSFVHGGITRTTSGKLDWEIRRRLNSRGEIVVPQPAAPTPVARRMTTSGIPVPIV